MITTVTPMQSVLILKALLHVLVLMASLIRMAMVQNAKISTNALIKHCITVTGKVCALTSMVVLNVVVSVKVTLVTVLNGVLMVVLVVGILTSVLPAMPHVLTTHSARILMEAISASAMMASFSTMMALLATILTNVLMERTHVTQKHKNVKTLLVLSHVNVNLDLEGVLILMSVHLRRMIVMLMRIVKMNLVHSHAHVKMDSKVTEKNAMTLMNAKLELTTAPPMVSAQTHQAHLHVNVNLDSLVMV